MGPGGVAGSSAPKATKINERRATKMKKKIKSLNERNFRKELLSSFFQKEIYDSFDFNKPSASYKLMLENQIDGTIAEVVLAYDVRIHASRNK